MKKILYLFIPSILSITLYSCGGNKADGLLKDWKATEITLGETVLSAEDIGGVYYSFKQDSSFVYTETGNTQVGTWAYDEKANAIELTYKEGGRKVIQKIQEFTPEKLILNYEEHGMKRSLNLIPQTK